MPFWKHALVQDTGYQNTASDFPVENDMAAALHVAQARANVITESAQRRISGKHPTARLKVFQVADRPVRTPPAKGIGTDVE